MYTHTNEVRFIRVNATTQQQQDCFIASPASKRIEPHSAAVQRVKMRKNIYLQYAKWGYFLIVVKEFIHDNIIKHLLVWNLYRVHRYNPLSARQSSAIHIHACGRHMDVGTFAVRVPRRLMCSPRRRWRRRRDVNGNLHSIRCVVCTPPLVMCVRASVCVSVV